MHAAVANLPDELDCRIVHLRFVNGRSLAQIAAELSLNYEEVRKRFRADLAD